LRQSGRQEHKALDEYNCGQGPRTCTLLKECLVTLEDVQAIQCRAAVELTGVH